MVHLRLYLHTWWPVVGGVTPAVVECSTDSDLVVLLNERRLSLGCEEQVPPLGPGGSASL